MTNVVSTKLDRRVFTTSDGRILGNEVRIDEHYFPFEDRPTEFTETMVKTAGPFYDNREAGKWVDELRAAQDVARAQRCSLEIAFEIVRRNNA